MILHTFSDNSVLKKINVRELVTIPVWRGNRYIDLEHARQIEEDIGPNATRLDSTIFRVIKYKEGTTQQTFLIDGQHRQHVLKLHHNQPQPPSFDVLVIEKEVEEESDAIEYFNTLNNVKPQFETDPKLLANKYIHALEAAFNITKPRNLLIRPEGVTTRRPYLSSDRLRSALEENVRYLKQSKESLATFVARVKEWNEEQLRNLTTAPTAPTTTEPSQASTTHPAIYITKATLEATLAKKFALALDPSLPWVGLCLRGGAN